jgi:hypothetical protein
LAHEVLAAHVDQAVLKVDVAPAQTAQLRQSQAGERGDEDRHAGQLVGGLPCDRLHLGG